MATVKKGMLTAAGAWRRHLRRLKRTFWKGERQAGKDAARADAKPQPVDEAKGSP